jgi:hypothetical protein
MVTVDAYPEMGRPKQSAHFRGSVLNDAATLRPTRIVETVVGS